MQTSIEDAHWDTCNIESMERAEALATVERVAIGNALMGHPVTRYVRRCPFEDCSRYPAISESYVSLSKLILGKAPRKGESRTADRTDSPNLIWSLPGQRKPSDSSGCGVFRSSDKDIPLKMCLSDPKDFIKAVGNHCGSLRCRNCMNYAAMQAGVRIEDRIMTPADIRGRKTGEWLHPKHWAISPPQDWMKGIAQRSDHFSALVDDLVNLLPAFGFQCGVLVFHPWRLSDDGSRWIFSPHFHAVGYGFFQNNVLRNALAIADRRAGGIWYDNGSTDSWVFNQIHAGEEMRSIRHTIGYIMTHVGLGSYDHAVDWDDAFEDILIPPEPGKGTRRVAKSIDPFIYQTDWRSTGCYAEHLEEVDWTDWTESRISGSIPTYRMFGDVNSVRVVSRYFEYTERKCPVCGDTIGLFHSIRDHDPEPVIYRRSSTIRCMKEDKELVTGEWMSRSRDFMDSGYTQLDFAMSIPQCSTPETKGIQSYDPAFTPDQRAERRDRCIVYVPSSRGRGLDPLIVTKEEARRMRAEGVI